MAKLSYAATPDNPLFLALQRVVRPKARRAWSSRDNATRNRRQERRAAENREQIAHALRRRSDEVARRFPELYAYVRSPAFQAWYASRSGQLWNVDLETDADLVCMEIQLWRDGKMPLPEAGELAMLLRETEK